MVAADIRRETSSVSDQPKQASLVGQEACIAWLYESASLVKLGVHQRSGLARNKMQWFGFVALGLVLWTVI
ncbi:hypothetical protein D3C87_1781600 [compost metagenome]